MTAPGKFDLFTIGHSNLPAEHFLDLLKNTGVTAVADVRSVPFSRRFPCFSGNTLAPRLASAGIAYLAMGAALGGRPRDPELFCDGVADYERMAAVPEFRAGLDQVAAAAKHSRVCLMCAEREPLDCHRCLLVGRALTERGLKLGHILVDGTVEPQAATEERLLARAGKEADLFSDRKARLAAAYRYRARAAAARLKP
jgi:uncharacterized protein (DUF488 family)